MNRKINNLVKGILSFGIIIFTFFTIIGCGSKNDGLNTPKHFQAIVIEIIGDTLLVSPLEEYSERKSSDKIECSISNITLEESIYIGDVVEICYKGDIQESYPAKITNVVSIKIIKNEFNS